MVDTAVDQEFMERDDIETESYRSQLWDRGKFIIF